MTTITLDNGKTVETGCYVDGHWGIYGIDHMMDQCAELVGFDTGDYPRVENDDMDNPDAYEPETRSYMADRLEDALNAHTPEGFLWHWGGGEFFLSPYCGNGAYAGCGDESCACRYDW